MKPAQPALFAQDPGPRPAVFVAVAVPLPLRHALTYGWHEALAPGVRVVVQVGGQRVVGYVLGCSTEPPAKVDAARVRPLRQVLDAEPVFPDDLLRFLREAADYYLHPLGEVLRTAAPAVDRRRADDDAEDPRKADGAKASLKARWARVREETFVALTPAARETKPVLRGDRQAQIVAMLEARDEIPMSELRVVAKGVRTVVAALEAKGLVTTERREIPDDPFFGAPVARDAPPPLNRAQRSAAEAIAGAVTRRERTTFLLHGVTGSGKTEVYLAAIAAAQAAGRGALLLLPEISLTPQLVGRCRARFGDNLAVMHSGLKDADRHAMWRRVRRGECAVVIGARSAVFAPLPDLGLILVDEEHDGSFKQDDHFRYHGRDLALLRAHRLGIPCVLGSATPSVESYQAALDARYELLQLPERATPALLPSVQLVDLKRMGTRGPTGHELLSLPLVRALEGALQRGEQAILFLNRRGFAPTVQCAGCDAALSCPQCSVALVLHRREGALRCHYCDHKVPFDGACTKCGSTEVLLLGVGTEKLERALAEAFPSARVGRLDRDVASAAGSEAVLEKLRDGELDILVGTQMVTKGHDMPGVTLVGVIAADASLTFPDFRAAERTFQLLAQVAGRAGRRELPGTVVIQSFQPEHPVLRRARDHDYEGFFADEIAARRELGYPPFGRLAALRMDGPEEPVLLANAQRIDGWLRDQPEVVAGAVRVLGPAPSPLARLRGRWRMQSLLRAKERPPLRAVLQRLARHLDATVRDGVRASIDVDPVQML